MKPDNRYGTCPKCSGKMRKDLGLKNTLSGTPEWPGSTVVTMSPSGKATFALVAKCSRCGHSIRI